MSKTSRLETKIRAEIQSWFDTRGSDFVFTIKEFCQGNRASLTSIMEMVRELGDAVFMGDGKTLNEDLLGNLEYGIFNLIGKFTSTPGGDALLEAIQENVIEYLTEIFTEVKQQWNLTQYKITFSFEEIDPLCSLISAPELDTQNIQHAGSELYEKYNQRQARDILDELVLFAKDKFHGEKKRKIAVNWLENPEKIKDFNWLSSLAGTSDGSVKVILTRIKHSVSKTYGLKTISDKLVLVKSEES